MPYTGRELAVKPAGKGWHQPAVLAGRTHDLVRAARIAAPQATAVTFMPVALLVAGYLAVWAAAGLPACGLAWLAGWLTGAHPGMAHVLAVAVFAVCGVYQLSSLKDRCLAHCRSPLALLLHYGSYRGRFRDLRVGAHHSGYCLGCCWGLMVILVAVGVMNVAAMVGLAALVLIEKVWRWGPAAGRIADAAALGLAVATIWLPWLAPGPARRTADDELTPQAQILPRRQSQAKPLEVAARLRQSRGACFSSWGSFPVPAAGKVTG